MCSLNGWLSFSRLCRQESFGSNKIPPIRMVGEFLTLVVVSPIDDCDNRPVVGNKAHLPPCVER